MARTGWTCDSEYYTRYFTQKESRMHKFVETRGVYPAGLVTHAQKREKKV